MKNNIYDDVVFFEKYSGMERSKKGLEGAGEWETLESMLPDFTGRRVLDLGCGYGWHCIYAARHGAASVVGVDISERMLGIAKEKNSDERITYLHMPIEDVDFAEGSFDVVLSSLAFHYLPSFEDIVRKVRGFLSADGDFVFSAEHPVFTAYGSQDWYYDANGQILHFPVDNYFIEGERKAIFLGEEVTKYHRTLTTYINTLIRYGFAITGVVEPQPSEKLLQSVPGMVNELRRPMMLIVSAKKDR